MSEVVRQISEYLVKKGHEVVVATSYCKQRDVSQINGVEIKSFKISGNFVNGYSGEIEEYKKYILNSNFDIISNFAAQQWATDLCFEILPNIQAKNLIKTRFRGIAFLIKECYQLDISEVRINFRDNIASPICHKSF